MDIRTNPTRPIPFVWIFGSFFICAKEIRVSWEGLFCSGTETHGKGESFKKQEGTEKMFTIRGLCNARDRKINERKLKQGLAKFVMIFLFF